MFHSGARVPQSHGAVASRGDDQRAEWFPPPEYRARENYELVCARIFLIRRGYFVPSGGFSFRYLRVTAAVRSTSFMFASVQSQAMTSANSSSRLARSL